MAVATERRLYVSTDKGLFQARSNGSGYDAQPLAFDRYAPMRWPVLVDWGCRTISRPLRDPSPATPRVRTCSSWA